MEFMILTSILQKIHSDGDGVGDNTDEFPDDANETVDSDGDGTGDNADQFPDDANETVDSQCFDDDANETVRFRRRRGW